MIFRRKALPKPQAEAQRKRELERRLRSEVGLSRQQAMHAVSILWESRQ